MKETERPIPQPSSQLVYWVFQLTGWGVLTLGRFVAAVTILNIDWRRLLLEMLLINGVGLLFSHWLRGYVRRNRWRELPIRQLAWRIFVASFVCGIPLGIATQFTYLTVMVDPDSFLREYAPALQFHLALPFAIAVEIFNWVAVFVVWLAIYFTALAVRKYRSAQLRQSETARALHLAELRLLKSQLNPHFLFNALNTVRSLIADNPGRAQNAVTHLANTLRYTLSSRQDELVALSQELDIVADYLQLESMRFEERLRMRYSGRRRRGGSAHSGDAAADPGGECHQARYCRVAGGRDACALGRVCRTRCSRWRWRIRGRRRRAPRCMRAWVYAMRAIDCDCCSASAPAWIWTCRRRRWPRRDCAFCLCHEGADH